MDLLLNNTKMRTIQNLRTEWRDPAFSFQELWQAALDGSLDSFERDQTGKVSSDQAIRLIHEILLCTVNLRVPNPCHLKLSLDSPPAPGSDRLDVSEFLRNQPQFREAISLADIGSVTRRWAVYLFLLLHMQIKPTSPIRLQDTEAFLQILESLRDSGDPMLPNRSTLAIGKQGFLRCLENQVQLRRKGAWEVIYEAPGPIEAICCYGQEDLIVLLADGTLAKCTPEPIRNLAGSRRIRQISAWGNHFILLCDDHTAISDLDVSGWQNLHWVHMGINSVSGISGQVCRAVQINSAPAIAEQTGLKAVYTRTTDDSKHFALLQEDNTLLTDNAVSPISHVEAAALSMYGCVYICHNKLWLLPYHSPQSQKIAELPPNFHPEQLCCRDDRILCGTAKMPFAARIPHILPVSQ